jgi:hypothetical protein
VTDDVEQLQKMLREARRELGKVSDRLHHTRVELALHKERAAFAQYKLADDDRYGRRMLYYARELMTAVDPEGYDRDGPYVQDHGAALVKIRKLRAVALAVEPDLLTDAPVTDEAPSR